MISERRPRKIARSAWLAMLGIAVACSSDEAAVVTPPAPQPSSVPEVASVRVLVNSPPVRVGERPNITAIALDALGRELKGEKFEWKSSAPDVFQTDAASGFCVGSTNWCYVTKAVGPGKATLTARSVRGGKEGSAELFARVLTFGDTLAFTSRSPLTIRSMSR